MKLTSESDSMTEPVRSSRKTRYVAGAVIVVVILAVVGYFGVGYVIAAQLTTVLPRCAAPWLENTGANTPAKFTNHVIADTSPYEMPDYDTITYPSRDNPTIQISAFLVYAIGVDDPNSAPTVIVVHGLNSCKREETILTAAGMLTHNGFNVLLPDMRDSGDSTIEDGLTSIGMKEYNDVLGGYDYLVSTIGVDEARVGVMGFSLGAATTAIAFAHEPKLRAMWLDSGFADINEVIGAELTRNNYPPALADGGLFMAQVTGGVSLRAFSPLTEMDKVDGRAVYLTHGTADTRLSVQYSQDLADRLQADGQKYELWLVDGVEHVQAINEYPIEYQAKLVTFFSDNLAAP